MGGRELGAGGRDGEGYPLYGRPTKKKQVVVFLTMVPILPGRQCCVCVYVCVCVCVCVCVRACVRV